MPGEEDKKDEADRDRPAEPHGLERNEDDDEPAVVPVTPVAEGKNDKPAAGGEPPPPKGKPVDLPAKDKPDLVPLKAKEVKKDLDPTVGGASLVGRRESVAPLKPEPPLERKVVAAAMLSEEAKELLERAKNAARAIDGARRAISTKHDEFMALAKPGSEAELKTALEDRTEIWIEAESALEEAQEVYQLLRANEMEGLAEGQLLAEAYRTNGKPMEKLLADERSLVAEKFPELMAGALDDEEEQEEDDLLDPVDALGDDEEEELDPERKKLVDKAATTLAQAKRDHREKNNLDLAYKKAHDLYLDTLEKQRTTADAHEKILKKVAAKVGLFDAAKDPAVIEAKRKWEAVEPELRIRDNFAKTAKASADAAKVTADQSLIEAREAAAYAGLPTPPDFDKPAETETLNSRFGKVKNMLGLGKKTPADTTLTGQGSVATAETNASIEDIHKNFLAAIDSHNEAYKTKNTAFPDGKKVEYDISDPKKESFTVRSKSGEELVTVERNKNSVSYKFAAGQVDFNLADVALRSLKKGAVLSLDSRNLDDIRSILEAAKAPPNDAKINLSADTREFLATQSKLPKIIQEKLDEGKPKQAAPAKPAAASTHPTTTPTTTPPKPADPSLVAPPDPRKASISLPPVAPGAPEPSSTPPPKKPDAGRRHSIR